MAHYALINSGNVVVQVITGVDETDVSHDWEIFYGELRNQVCKRTSYNGNIRGTYAGIGYSYNAEEDIFVAPQPYPSWVLDSNYDWQAPVPYPNDGQKYVWDEATLSWVLFPGPM